MDPFLRVAAAFSAAQVRYVVMGVWGANYYAKGKLFLTQDQDVLLPREPDNLLRAWNASESLGLDLLSNDEPLDRPRDYVLAKAVVERVALTTATDGDLVDVDLSLVMGNFTFDEVWQRRRVFRAEGVAVTVASLVDIIDAKVAANRPKDREFLAAHAEELRKLLKRRR